MFKKIIVSALATFLFGVPLLAQVKTNETVLASTSKQTKQKEIQDFRKAVQLAREKGWPLSIRSKSGNIAFLISVDEQGYPVYYGTENNIIAAATTRANALWPGGSSGLSLTGADVGLKDRMAIWDGGAILNTHVELTGRILQKDDPSSNSDHSTHVAGTMIATGVNPLAKGMAYGTQRVIAYDFNNDASEMSAEASGLLLSNHSYGTISGWHFNDTQNRWEFWGRFGETEDYKFGYYDGSAQMYDSIAYNAPYYLIVKASGNNRGETGPAVGQTYWRYSASGVMINAGARPADLSSNDGYDIIATSGVAKNILTVGAVNGIEYGYNKKEDVVMSSFSSWGPTDDGRIKPDIVADGVDVLSSIATSDNSYASFSGTSMATPNTTGSLLLLQQYYAQLHNGTFMRAATLKGLAIHTADEAGAADGPDYKFGWGLLNVAKAAEVIRSNNTGKHLLQENVLNNGASYTTTVVASGQGPLVATIVWTDPKATVGASVLNDHTKKLVNDLDIRITKGTTTYLPWILDPANPSSAATKGDNILDNVERIDINDVVPGQTYTITVTHKGTLERGSQAFSLLVSGVGGQAYCTSAPLSNNGARIDSVGFANIHNPTATGCTSYSNFTDLTASVETGQSLPFSIKLSSCDATATDKTVKVYVDFNNNGSFTDAGELVATSATVSGDGIFTGSIAIPSNVTVGNIALMRIVAEETANASDINPCGSYGKGETQDYRIKFAAPGNDVSMIELVSPAAGSCSNDAQLVTVRLRNNGSVDKSNIPITISVKNGGTTVASLSSIYPGTLAAGNVSSYTFQSPVNLAAGTSYNFELTANEATDQNRINDTLRTTLTISGTPAAPQGAAEICGNNAMLKTLNPSATANYFWYTAPTTNNAIAAGSNTTSTTIPANNTYYLGTGSKGSAGLASKDVFPNGGGYLSATANYMKYSASVPVTLESARLYVKFPGKVSFIVADIVSTTPTGGYSYQPISTTTIDVYATTPNQAPGIVAAYDPADTGAIFLLNLSLPAGNHAIIIAPQGSTNLFRNNNGTGNIYPTGLTNVFSFTGNGATLASDPNYYQTFYYYLYNVKIHTLDCPSDRTTIVAPVAPTPVITQSNDSLVSSISSGNQWYLNGNALAGANSNKYKPLQTGSYSVGISDNFGCTRTSANFNFVLTAIDPVANATVGLSVNPNPSNGVFVLKYRSDKKDDLRLEVLNIQGQAVYTRFYPQFIGSLSEQINLQTLPSGMYVLKLIQGSKSYLYKLVLSR